MAIFGSALRRTRLLAAFAAAILALAPIPFAARGARECDTVCIAKQLLLALYPDLAGKNAVLKITSELVLESQGSMATFDASVLTALPDKPNIGHSKPPQLADQLQALFRISPGSLRVLEIQSSGPEVSELKNRKLTELVDSHPEWSDDQAIQALKEAGALFGPDARDLVRDRLPFKRLEPIIGKIRLTSLHFQVRTDSVPPLAAIGWQADFKARKAGGETRYFLAIEPFGGRPVMFHQK